MSTFDTNAAKIIEEQELVIGPLARSEAQKVTGLQFSSNHDVILQNGDPKAVVDRLVAQYERLFGKASQEVCKEAASSIIASMPRSDVPASLLA